MRTTACNALFRYFPWLPALLLIMAAGLAHAAETPSRSSFNHTQTGFPLTGAHAQADCQTCHLQGMFKGTPRQCEVCHTQGSRTASTFKPNNHPQTAMPCNQCHVSQISWSGARFDHLGIAPGSCAGCHNGVTATGKPSRHIFTTSSCDTCHRTTAWVPAGYNHAGVAPGTCTTCHGVTATGKPGGHVATTLECDQCHSTRAWQPAGYNHTSAVPGQCTTCHGVTATGKHAGHIPTNPDSLSCDACHRTDQPFSSSTFRHRADQGVGPTGCFTCHNGNYRSEGARGRPNNGEHPNNDTCEQCHVTTTWDPIGNRLPAQRKFRFKKH
jgi:hypothetical protein